MLVSCANARLSAAVPDLQARLGVPVVTSNQAAARSALRLVGRATTDLGWGEPARRHPRRPGGRLPSGPVQWNNR